MVILGGHQLCRNLEIEGQILFFQDTLLFDNFYLLLNLLMLHNQNH